MYKCGYYAADERRIDASGDHLPTWRAAAGLLLGDDNLILNVARGTADSQGLRPHTVKRLSQDVSTKNLQDSVLGVHGSRLPAKNEITLIASPCIRKAE